MDLGLTGSAVLVTGGSSGIGRAAAIAYGREGARVALTFHSRRDAAEEVAKEVTAAGGDGYAVAMDLSDPESIGAVVADVVERWNGLDVLVNNAVRWGAGSIAELPTSIEEAGPDHWNPTLRANLTGPFLVTRAAAPALRRSSAGRVVLVSSDVAEQGFLGAWAYGSAKAGLHGLAASLAPDLGRDGVLVNVVMPGITLEDGRHRSIPADPLARIAAARPAGKLPTVDDVASAILFLGSPVNGGTTGEILRVTGGRPAPV